MPISLRSLYAQGDWPLGETRRIASADDLIAVGADGKAINRSAARAILASAYPEFYNLAIGAVTARFFNTRTATGLTGVNGINSDKVSTWIATGPAGGISRSADNGVSWTAVASGIAAALGKPCYGAGVWVIPYATGKVLRSTNGGATWVDTTVTGVPNFSIQGDIAFANGTFIYAYQNYVYWSADGTTWVDIAVNARGSAGNVASLTVGQGLHVLLCGNTPRYSADGGATWQTGTNRGITNPMGGLYWTGQYWVTGGYVRGETIPNTQPAPQVSGTIFSLSQTLYGAVTGLYLAYTVNSQSGPNWYDMGNAAAVYAADSNGAVLATSLYSSYGYHANAELKRLVDRLSYASITVTGGPSAGTFGSTEDGTIFKRDTASNQLGLKAPSTVLELTLDLYNPGPYIPAIAGNNWYTRIK
jgi:hypothetical protein